MEHKFNASTSTSTSPSTGAAPATLRPAPYGRACVNCARAKCKCILRSDNGSCERCFRLKKECHPSSSVRKKRIPSRGTSSQTARLERKLDGLVSLLKANSQGGLSEESLKEVSNIVNAATGVRIVDADDDNPIPTATHATGTNTAAPSPSSFINNNHNGNNNGPSRPSQTPYGMDKHHHHSFTNPQNSNYGHAAKAAAPTTGPLTPSSSTSSSFPYILSREAEITPEEEHLWYSIFIDHFVDHVPYMKTIVQNMSCVQLRQERPFVWLCIMAVTCPFVQKQSELGRVVREVLAREVLVEGERRLDFLVGALCFAQWAHYHFQMGPILTLLSGVCASILIDLELDRPRQHESSSCMKHTERLHMPRFHHKIHIPESRTMEHRRIALTTFLLSSSTAFFQHKAELLSWSPYLETCVEKLSKAEETLSDDLLVFQVKMQRILGRITEIYARLRGLENEQTTRLLLPYLRSLKHQVTALRKDAPQHITENKLIQLSLLHVEVAINEMALTRANYTPLTNEKNLESMDCLLECLQSIGSWIDLFMTFDSADYIGMPFRVWKQLSLMMYTLVRMATLEDPAWDSDRVRQTINLPGLLEHVSTSMSKVAQLAPWKRNADNVHNRSSKLMSTLVTWTRAVYEGSPLPSSVTHVQNMVVANAASVINNGGPMDHCQAETAATSTSTSTPTASASASALPQPNPMLVMNDVDASAAAFAQQEQQYGQAPFYPEMLFPYFNQEPGADDLLGFWDIWSLNKPGNLAENMP